MKLRSGVAAVVLLAAWTSAYAARLALVIGNDTYDHVPSLTNARNDANLIAATLRDAGFEVVGNVRSNLDRKSMWGALDQFERRINKGDEVVFYYAGHGVQIGADSLLLPVDIEAKSDEQVLRDAVNLVSVQDELKSAKFALLVIDACRNNPFPIRANHTRSIGESRGLIPIEPAEGNAILMSASRGQTALDFVPGITEHNGLFTYWLVQAIKTPGLDILSALRQVRDRIEDEAKRANHDQRPALVEEMRGTFILFPGSASPALQQSTYVAPATQAPEELVAVVNSSNISRAFFEFYVKAIADKPSSQLTADQRTLALNNLVRAEVLAQEAQKKGLDTTSETASLLTLARRNTLEATKHGGAKPEDAFLFELARLNILGQALKDRYLADKHPTDRDLQTEYQSQLVTMPKQEYHARHILLSTKELADDIIRQLENGGSFEALARFKSLDSSKKRGGDLGWFTLDRMAGEFSSALTAMKPGEYSKKPVQTRYGWHVIQLLAIRDAIVPSFAQVKEQLRQVVEVRKFRAYADELVQKARVDRLADRY